MPGSGRQPINAPAGGPNSAGVPWIGLGILVVLTLILATFVAYFFFDVGNDSGDEGSPGPALITSGPTGPASGDVEGSSVGSLGYPAVATRNTTRISGSDPAGISLAAALAAYPTIGPGTPPNAVTVVNADQWQAGVAAATLSAKPVGAPILLAPSGKLTESAADALSEFDPQGAPTTGESEVFAVGKVAPPSGYDTKTVNAKDPADLAIEIAELKRQLTDEPPAAFVLISSEEAEYGGPAASWLARSGDVVLYTGKDEIPKATVDYLKKKENKDVPVFVLGPASVVSPTALKALDKVSTVERVGGEDPVAAALELVRFSSGTFGWNLNAPGHGYMVARSDRPMDAIAATALSTGGTWPALLLTDDSDKLPKDVGDYFLDVKPGYDTDPTRALYNHVWIIGDEITYRRHAAGTD
ncbi:MAG: hypothetical protein IPK93_09345 [Solirubrobacterales bacterium]|nr:hypothetical protein [Solirubrobacterales bacterium]